MKYRIVRNAAMDVVLENISRIEVGEGTYEFYDENEDLCYSIPIVHVTEVKLEDDEDN